jgi:hypothetical protein
MSKEIRDRKFGKAEVARDAGEGMAEYMRGYILEFRLSANALEDADNANEMSISPVGRKDEERPLTRRLSLDAVHRNFSKDPDLCAALGVGKANAMIVSVEPGSLQPQRLHPPESRQQHEADG